MPDNTIIVAGGFSAAAWAPSIGPHTLKLLDEQVRRDTERAVLLKESVSILSSCVPSSLTAGRRTGLVVGYVQSGKTLSFTTVAALARDNGYRMVIVITGTSVNLADQNSARVKKDLGIGSSGLGPWAAHHNPKASASGTIAGDLAEWMNPSVPREQCRTVLITVMKQHTHLQNLLKLLKSLDLANAPVLLVDDEADQAGLNTEVNDGESSTTYAQLLAIRAAAPHLSYLQYTATPQAPLLINVIDILSPEFAEVITPGEDYVGGKQFFDRGNSVVHVIPPSQIPGAQPGVEPPEFYVHALRVFMLGVATGLIEQDPEGNRSMMVHPSQKTAPHVDYCEWTKQVVRRWMMMCDGDAEELAELKAEFAAAYIDLAKTAKTLPSDEVLLDALPRAFRRTTSGEPQLSNSTRAARRRRVSTGARVTGGFWLVAKPWTEVSR
jgi:hypothetical protein